MGTNLPLLRSLFGVVRPLAECQWFGVEPIAAGVFGVPAGLLVMAVVSWLTPPPGEATQALIDRMRFPAEDER
jgi:cation/acetate symporter